MGQSFDPELATAIAGLAEWPDEAARRGIVTEDTRGRLAFRHDLVREAFYGEIGWAKRPALHRAIAEALEATSAPPSSIAEHWARGREPDRARRCFLAAADTFRDVHAYRDGSRAIRRALELWPEGAEEPGRLDALRHLGRCAELAGDLGGAVLAWREAAEGHRRGGQDAPLGEVLRSLAGALELQGRWEDALAAREQAASAFAAGALGGDAAGERLAAATHLRSAASFRAALALLETAKAEATAAHRPDLEARILGLEGNVRARMGEGAPAIELVRRVSRTPSITTSAAPRPRSTSGWPTRSSTSVTTVARGRPTTRRSDSARPTSSSRPHSCVWPASVSCCATPVTGITRPPSAGTCSTRPRRRCTPEGPRRGRWG